MNKVSEKSIDPITLQYPEKEVEVYDWSVKRKFIFDAKSLATLIEANLNYQICGFAEPIYPRNPLNNLDFRYEQLLSIYNQLKKYGELRWGLTTLQQYNFNNRRWQMYHKSALTMNAIKNNLIAFDTHEARELLTDFIFSKMDDLKIEVNNYTYNVYQVAMVRSPNHWYLEKFKALAIQYYEAEHFNHNINRAINIQFIKIIKKQRYFIKDLIDKNII
jgi:hypothetical protein